MSDVTLRVEDARQRDVGRGIARINQETMQKLGISASDVIEIIGKRTTSAIAWPAYSEDQNRDIIRIDGFTRKNAGVAINEYVIVRPAKVNEALNVTLAPVDMRLNVDEDFTNFVRNRLMERTLVEGDTTLVMMLGHEIPFVVVKTEPFGVVKITKKTNLNLLPKPAFDMLIEPQSGKSKDLGVSTSLAFEEERRKQVLNFLSVKAGLGIPIQESDCSLEQRREIGHLALCLEEREYYLKRSKEVETSKKSVRNWVGTGVFILFFVSMIFIFIGILRFLVFLEISLTGWIFILNMIIFLCGVPFVLTFIVVRKVGRKYDVEKQLLLQKAEERERYFQTKGGELANSIKKYILTSSRPEFFRAFLKAAEEKGVILKTLECPNCSGILEVSEILKAEEVLKCKYCGKSILVINLYQKIKETLS
jgi:DNA-directed RNA polymerase subunit RPC12/RpoP